MKKQDEELKRLIKTEQKNPTHIFNLGKFYQDNKENQKAFNTYVNCISKFDELKQQKEVFDKKQLTTKCALLSRIALMIKMENIKTDEDSEVLQLYYLLRAKKAYAEELNDENMSERIQ